LQLLGRLRTVTPAGDGLWRLLVAVAVAAAAAVAAVVVVAVVTAIVRAAARMLMGLRLTQAEVGGHEGVQPPRVERPPRPVYQHAVAAAATAAVGQRLHPAGRLLRGIHAESPGPDQLRQAHAAAAASCHRG
jgi:hypothetical protein